eukprot:2276136-Rhodomonas_salina.2
MFAQGLFSGSDRGPDCNTVLRKWRCVVRQPRHHRCQMLGLQQAHPGLRPCCSLARPANCSAGTQWRCPLLPDAGREASRNAFSQRWSRQASPTQSRGNQETTGVLLTGPRSSDTVCQPFRVRAMLVELLSQPGP